jgi:hypothetical protein
MASLTSRESAMYDEVCQYLLHGSYPGMATKQEKAVIRKRAKKFRVVDGILHYVDGKNGIRRVSTWLQIR